MNTLIENTVNDFYNEIGIMITIPKTIKWEDYLKEIEVVKDGKQEMNYKLSSRPSKVDVGGKCFICHNGYVKGWMTISSIMKKSFQCTTTSKQWNEAWYIGRTGEFHPITEKPQKGFMGYKYVKVSDYL